MPGTHTPKPNAPHTLIEVGRVGGMAPFFGLWGIATDEVCVLRQEDEAILLQQAAARESIREDSQAGTGTPSPEPSMIARELLATLSWQIEIPGLLDMFLIITSLSLSFPNYNVLMCPCFWLAREIYQTLRHGYTMACSGEQWGQFVAMYQVPRYATIHTKASGSHFSTLLPPGQVEPLVWFGAASSAILILRLALVRSTINLLMNLVDTCSPALNFSTTICMLATSSPLCSDTPPLVRVHLFRLQILTTIVHRPFSQKFIFLFSFHVLACTHI